MKVCFWHRNDRGRSRSPDKSSWGDRSKSFNRERSRSRSPDRAAPHQHSQGYSFHNAMMDRRGGSEHTKSFDRDRSRSRSPPKYERAPAYSFHQSMMDREKGSRNTHPSGGRSDRSPGQEWGGSPVSKFGNGRHGGSQSSFHGEEEEGMIPDEDTTHQDGGAYGVAE